MATVTTPLVEKAESIFTDLGYVVESDGPELRAQRKWRSVQVTPVDEPAETPSSGELRCFVTWQDDAGSMRERLAESDHDYEWAVIGVADDGEYEVYREPTTTLAT